MIIVFSPCEYSSQTVVLDFFYLLNSMVSGALNPRFKRKLWNHVFLNLCFCKTYREKGKVSGDWWREWGDYGYLLSIVFIKYMISVLFILIKKFLESLKVNISYELIFSRNAKNIHCRKDSLFNEWCFEYWIFTHRRFKLYLSSYTKLNSKVFIYPRH